MATIDLSTGTFSRERLPESMMEDFLGGRGLGGSLFAERVPPAVSPLDPANCMVFITGPLTGTKVPTSGRFALVTKSPLTGSLFYSNSGGSIGVHLKRCGYAGLIIYGASPKPVYIVVDGEKGIEIRDACHLWGLNSGETYDKLIESEGKRAHVLMIGPAGENQVSVSSIMNDGGRTFGRGGVGAVMGSKKLKAIVIKNGNIPIELHDEELFNIYVKQAFDKIKVAPITSASLPLFGTPALVNVINDLGMFPVRNFSEGFDDNAYRVSGESIREHIFVRQEGCFNCPINCGRMTRTSNQSGKGPEYETVWALGPNCGIFDLEIISEANYLCNQLGMDTISVGGSISCAMELQQKGKIANNDIRFGNAGILKPLIAMMAFKEGIGKDLGEGSRCLAKKYDEEDSSMQVKGLELPAYDPRGAMGQALGYATGNRGGCHLTGYMAAMEVFAAPKKVDRFTLWGKADLLMLKQNQNAVEDSLSVCKFLAYALGFDFYARFVSSTTGLDINISRLMEIGERIYNLERLYNFSSGLSRKDDCLPKRFLDTPLQQGLSKGRLVPLETMLVTYYEVRGWDKYGFPSESTLKRLGLTEIYMKINAQAGSQLV